MKRDCSLGVKVDPTTGQLLVVHDQDLDLPCFESESGAELCLNDVPLNTSLIEVQEAKGEHLTIMEAHARTAYGAGVTMRVRRMLSRGGVGLRAGIRNSFHLRYEVTRVPNRVEEAQLDYNWQPPIEAPLQLDSLTVLNAPTNWFGPKTRMRSIAIGGTGPREHVSLEDGLVADVVPWLQTSFRTEFPGQLSANGALYYHPETEQWVWVLVRRPTTTGRILFDTHRQAYRFGYHMDFPLQEEIFTPAVSIFWGQGMVEADRLLASQFDLYEEPPEWAWNTTWFWLHPAWTKDVNYERAADVVKLLSGDCGVNGFGLMAHDVPLSGNDIDVGSPAPSPVLGGNVGMRHLVSAIRECGAHSYAWISRHGHRPDTMDFNPDWSIRGVDGRPIRLRNTPDSGVNLDIVNPADPDFQAYICRWIQYYVHVLGIDGLFWDSGFQSVPPDFGNKSYLRFPGETNARAGQFYERILRYGQSLSPDFFMWVEGLSLDMPMNFFSVDARSHGEHSGNEFMQRLAHLGPKRLMWRSAWPHDLASGFVMLNPMNDVGRSMADYKAIARDPMNQWVCKTVRERGVRQARGVADGISRLDEFVVVSPGQQKRILLSDSSGKQLCHVISGVTVSGTQEENGMAFDLPEEGAYSF